MNNTIKKSDSRKERGIALLFALGILGMMSVLTLAFASFSFSAKKMATTSSDTQLARSIALSALNRVRAIAAMTTVYTTDTPNQFTKIDNIIKDSYFNIISKDHSGGTNHKDWLWKLDFPANSMEKLFMYNASSYDPDWQYIHAGGNTDPLIGRFAFITIPITADNSGIFDPTSFGKFQNDQNGTNASDTHRLGAGIHELSIDDLAGTNGAVPLDTLANFQDFIRNNYSQFSRIRNFDELRGYGTTGLQPSAGNSAADLNTVCRQMFTLPSVRNPEAFWFKASDKVDTGTTTRLYHRFNLARTDWDSITVNDLLGLDSSGNIDKSKFILYQEDSGEGANRAQRYSTLAAPDTVQNASTGLDNVVKTIPWLAFWSDAGDFGSGTARAKQIAANMIDYFDTNSTVTSDSTNWETQAPTYTGNEKTPYINEYGGEFIISLEREEKTVDKVKYYKFHLKLTDCRLFYELIDFFSTSSSTPSFEFSLTHSFKLHYSIESSESPASGDFTYNPSNQKGNAVEASGGINIAKLQQDVSGTNSNAEGSKTFFIAGMLNNLDLDKTICSYPSGDDWTTDSSFSVKITTDYGGGYSYLKYNDKSADYANGKALEVANERILTCSGTTPATSTYVFSYQAVDPRHNLIYKEGTTWKKNVGTDRTVMSFDASTTSFLGVKINKIFGRPNYGSKAGVLGSKAPYDDSSKADGEDFTRVQNKNVLTQTWANICNIGICRSPWEIGAIHRAGIGQTINLQKFNTDTDVQGGGAYSKGDANILDQVKMHSETFEYGKINVYEPQKILDDPTKTASTKKEDYKYALSALFQKITLKKIITENDLYGGTEISKSDVKDRLIEKMREDNTIVTNTYTSRGAFIGAAANILAYEGTTDAEKEEIIGKTAMLLKAIKPQHDKNTLLMVVILAQSIREGKAGNTPAALTGFEKGYTTFTGTTSSFAEPYWTPGAKVTGTYQPGSDTITGEQKIVAWLMRGNDQKWKVIKVDYVE